jgi:hypothetical protein
MANTNKPDGFTPAYHMYGGVIRPAKMRIASTTNASIFSGDVVNLSSGYVIQGTATGTPIGVFYGVYYTATDGTPTFSKVWTADTATQGSADAEALVYNDPAIVYEAQFTAALNILFLLLLAALSMVDQRKGQLRQHQVV